MQNYCLGFEFNSVIFLDDNAGEQAPKSTSVFIFFFASISLRVVRVTKLGNAAGNISCSSRNSGFSSSLTFFKF